MAMDQDTVTRLVQVLKDCTARVTRVDGPPSAGTGFFVDRDLLLTNRHVVGDASKVMVHPYGGESRPGSVIEPHEESPDVDIALIRVESLPDEPQRPAVLLDTHVPEGSAYQLVGYPREDLYKGDVGLEVISIQGHRRDDNETKRVTLIRLEAGQMIKKGMSGGAVLSEVTGAVIAVTVYAESETDALGGAAIPIAAAVNLYDELGSLASQPPEAAMRWRDSLGRPQWEELGKVWDPARQLDIYLSGDRSRWRIGLKADEDGEVRTVRDLGDEMGELLLQWARHRRALSRAEVELLGRLLSAALFPSYIADQLPPRAAAGEDAVLVRLHLDPGGPLGDLPWEFVTIPGSEPVKFLAAEPGYAFTRVASMGPLAHSEGRPSGNPSGAQRPAGPSETEDGRVLVVVVQPDGLTPRLPVVLEGRNLRSWPPCDSVTSVLTTAISSKRRLGEPVVLSNPELSELRQVASDGNFDVVHYIGFGSVDNDEPLLALFDGDDDLTFHGVDEVFDSFKACAPRLAVFEFASPPLDETGDPVKSGALAAALGMGVDAVVSSRPVHPRQYEKFNEVLYGQIALGVGIEESVQRAREATLSDKRIDFAGFGWFSLTTGPVTRATIVDAVPTTPGSKGVDRGQVAAGAATTPAQEGSNDAFAGA